MISIMKKYGIYILLILSIGLNFIQRSCSNSNISSKSTIVKIKTPEIKGEIQKSKTVVIPTPKNEIVYKDKQVIVDNPITKKLLNRYIKENDSLKRLKMYGEAITEREQVNIFENDDLKASVKSKTQGKLLDILLTDYIIKSKELPITLPPSKNSVFAVYSGGGLYYNQDNQKLGYKVDLGFQNKKGDILDIGYDPLNKTVFLEYKLRIINIKK